MTLLFVAYSCIFFSARILVVNSINDTTYAKENTGGINTSKSAGEDEYKKKVCENKPSCLSPNQSSENDQTLYDRGCMCDAECKTYGDCCPDSKFYDQNEQSQNYFLFYCSIFGYIKNRCPTNFTNVDIVEKCQMANATFRSIDVDLVAFVTNLKTRLIYANKYCAQCDNVDDYVVWNVTYDCYTLAAMIFDEESEQIFRRKIPQLVKLNATDNNFYAQFNDTKYQCIQSIVKPLELRKVNSRKCLSTISSCPGSDFNSKETGTKCRSYTSIVYDAKNSYRNKDCAKCNGIPEANISSCKSPEVVVPYSAFSEVFRTDDKAQGSDICGDNALASVKEKFCS